MDIELFYFLQNEVSFFKFIFHFSDCHLGYSVSCSLYNGNGMADLRLFLLTEVRKVLFGHRVRVNDSFVVGKGIDLDSFSFNPDNFCSSHERSLQQKVKKISQEQSCDFYALHKFPHC